MEQSENLALAAAGAAPAGEQAQGRAWEPSRWRSLGAMSAAAALAALAAGGGLRLWQRLERMEDGVLSRTAAVASKVDELTRANASLREEVVALRGTLASAAGEDVLFLKAIVLKPTLDPELARNVAHLVQRYALRYNRDPNLVLAMIAVESDFNPNAVSKVGATGLMQVMPHWKKILGIEKDLTDPETSINYGLQVLAFYEQMYRDLELALTAYNRGPGPVDNALVRGASPENGYAAKILATYERIRRLNTRSSLP